MKKSLLLALLVAATSIVYGQEVASKWRGISVAGGMNLSKIACDFDYEFSGYKSGYAIDIYTGYNFTDIVSIDAGLQYSVLGGGAEKSANSSARTDINYLVLPADLNIRLCKGLYGSVGGYVALEVSPDQQLVTYMGGGTSYKNVTANGFDAGVRYKIFYELSRFRFTAGYSQGLVNVFDVAYGDSFIGDYQDHFTSRNGAFYFGVALKLYK